jgi:hypothetical protein
MIIYQYFKKINTGLLPFLVFLFPAILVEAQVSSLRVNLRTDESTVIPPEAEPYKDVIIANIQNHLSLYNDAASLIDVENGGVTTESIEKFRMLFHSNARVFNDLQQYGIPIPIDEYIALISEKMSLSGQQFKIADMLLQKVENNPAVIGELYFEAKVKVNKLMLTRIDEKTGKAVTVGDGGDLIPLDFNIIIQGKDLKQVEIYGINGKIEPRPKPFNHEVKITASYGINLHSSFESYSNFESGFSPVITPGLLLDGGISYARSFKRGGHAKWIVGANYGIHQWEVEVTGDNNRYNLLPGNSSENTLSFINSYNYQNVKNKISFSFVQGILGVQLPIRPISGYKMEYWLEAGVLPTWVTKKESMDTLSAKINRFNQVVFDGTPTDYCNVIESRPALYNDRLTSSSLMSVGVQLKPGIKYYLNGNKSSALTFSAGYVYYFGSWIDKNSTNVFEDVNSIPDNGPTSLVLNRLTPALLRIELGLSFKLNR